MKVQCKREEESEKDGNRGVEEEEENEKGGVKGKRKVKLKCRGTGIPVC